MSWTSTASTATLITCVAFFIGVIGLATPFWISTMYTYKDYNNKETTFSTFISIWYVMTCISGEVGSCASRAIDLRFEGATSLSNFEGSTVAIIAERAATVLGGLTTWNILQIVSTAGVGLCGLAMLFLVCCRCAGIHSRGWFVTSLLFLVMGDTLVIGTTVFTAIIYRYGTTFSVSKDQITAETFPWSLLVFGIGSFLGIIAIILLLVITCAWRRYGAYVDKEGLSLDNLPLSERKHSIQRHRGYDNPQYPDPHDYRNYYLYDTYSGRNYTSREIETYTDFLDDYKSSSRHYRSAGYSNGDYDSGYRLDARELRDGRHYSPGSYDPDYYIYRPSSRHSQQRY